MKPEHILKCHVLDIIFENRNKDYGAYSLRRNYNKRLIQALGIMIVLVSLFVLLQGMQGQTSQSGRLDYTDTIKLVDVILVDDVPKDKPKEKQPEKANFTSEPLKTITNDVPVIKPDDEVTETNVPTEDDLAKNIIADAPNERGEGDPDIVFKPGDDGPTTTGNIPPVEPEIPAGPADFADVMPSFNGDIVKYMLRHLRQPDDLGPGERIVVKVKFVVNEEGNITDIDVLQSGRSDLDKEVVRVIRTMPRWNPGKQSGRPVPVFFKMPVTFVSNPN